MPRLSVYRGRKLLFDYQINKEETVVGRHRLADVPLDSDAVSRKHLIIRREGPQFIAVDMNATNGVYLNGARTRKAVLRSGDQIEVAQHLLVFDHPEHEQIRERVHWKRSPSIHSPLDDEKSHEVSWDRVGHSAEGVWNVARHMDQHQRTSLIPRRKLERVRAGLALKRGAHLSVLVNHHVRDVPLHAAPVRIGWDRDTCDILLPGRGWPVKQVAEVTPTSHDGVYMLRSLSILKPVRKEGRRSQACILRDGDLFTIGNVTFKYRAPIR